MALQPALLPGRLMVNIDVGVVLALLLGLGTRLCSERDVSAMILANRSRFELVRSVGIWTTGVKCRSWLHGSDT
jgi:hypothetical protein